MNCTRHAQQATLTWLGHYSSPAATGCPAVDPIAETISVPASRALRAYLAYTVLVGCTAKLLTVTARLTGASGTVLAAKTARLHIVQERVAQPGGRAVLLPVPGIASALPGKLHTETRWRSA